MRPFVEPRVFSLGEIEDNPARLQERLSKAMPECDLDAPTDIHFATQSQKLGNGLAEQLNAFLDIHPQTRLIVIDTMQYVRNRGNFTGTYSGDYRPLHNARHARVLRERGGAKRICRVEASAREGEGMKNQTKQ